MPDQNQQVEDENGIVYPKKPAPRVRPVYSQPISVPSLQATPPSPPKPTPSPNPAPWQAAPQPLQAQVVVSPEKNPSVKKHSKKLLLAGAVIFILIILVAGAVVFVGPSIFGTSFPNFSSSLPNFNFNLGPADNNQQLLVESPPVGDVAQPVNNADANTGAPQEVPDISDNNPAQQFTDSFTFDDAKNALEISKQGFLRDVTPQEDTAGQFFANESMNVGINDMNFFESLLAGIGGVTGPSENYYALALAGDFSKFSILNGQNAAIGGDAGMAKADFVSMIDNNAALKGDLLALSGTEVLPDDSKLAALSAPLGGKTFSPGFISEALPYLSDYFAQFIEFKKQSIKEDLDAGSNIRALIEGNQLRILAEAYGK